MDTATATPKAAKANAPKAKAPAKKYEIATVKAGALSTDVGPKVLSMFLGVDRAQVQIDQLRRDSMAKGYEMLSLLTQGIMHAAENDDNIDLAAYFKEDRAAINRTGEQLRIALGISEVTELSDGVKKLTETSAASKMWSKMTKTQRTNFSTMVKKCAQSALGLIDMGADVEYDDKAHTLLIEGPKVAKAFGQGQVLLNEKQTIVDGDKKVTLAMKPSFQKLADIAKVSRGITPVKRADSRPGGAGGTGGIDYTKDGAFTQLAKTVVSTIEKLPTPPSSAVVTALKSIQNAVGVVLNKRAPKAA